MSTYYISSTGSQSAPYSSRVTGAKKLLYLTTHVTLAPGDIINVCDDGIIDEGLGGTCRITAGVTLQSDPANVTMPTIYLHAALWVNTVRPTGSGITIQGIEFDYEAGGVNYAAIYVADNINGLIVQNCKFSGYNTAILLYTMAGTPSTPAAIIRNNIFALRQGPTHTLERSLYLDGCSYVKIINNTFAYMPCDVADIFSWHGGGNCSDVKIINNIFRCSTSTHPYAILGAYLGTPTYDYNIAYGYTNSPPYVGVTPGAHCLLTDPLLVSDADFHLQAGSPCIGSGIGPDADADVPTIDYTGDVRSGNTTNIGAYNNMADLSTEKVKPNYIKICGPQQPIRFDGPKTIDITQWLPDTLKDSTTNDLLGQFEDFLNTMFDGVAGFQTTITETGTSANYIYGTPSNWDTKKISILEKVNRIAELHDPALIDLDYLQYFAGNMGYNIDLSRGDLGSVLATSEETVCSGVDIDKYLRFVVSNLPSWYEIKTTRNAIKVMLFSFGMIGDIAQYFTDSYLPTSEGGKWEVPDYDMIDNNLTRIPNNYFPTPHFIIWTDYDKSTTDLSWSYDTRKQLVNAIESIRPVNTVFRHLGAYVKRILDVYVEMQMRSRRYISIPSNGYSDSWVP